MLLFSTFYKQIESGDLSEDEISHWGNQESKKSLKGVSRNFPFETKWI